ncbi:MAG: protein-methionine-sulfoxide reductase catalytic subunit MsrP [Rhodothermales bacterium]
MTQIILRPGWQARECDATPEDVFRNRRQFIKKLGLGTAALAATGCMQDVQGDQQGGPLETIPADAPRDGYPAARNERYQVPERVISDRIKASSYNNFYEFDGSSKKIWHLTNDYDPFPMTIEVRGLVEKRLRLDVSDLIRSIDLEERIYRFRCVEAWAMTVPWTGFPLRKLVERCKPLSKATHVRFVSVNRPKQMPGIANQPWYPWPYYEGLRMDEATNDLAFVATGMYGEPMPKQNGSPLRLALPWKYGYKGPKAIVRMEFVDSQPPTLWNDLQPKEYGFLSNVNPNIPHLRWSQSTEEVIDDGKRVPTQLFNGYSEWVSALYPDEPTTPSRPVAR